MRRAAEKWAIGASEDGMQAGKHPQPIATKVLPPRCAGLIERPRLLELVTQVPTKPLSVIKAPAGFGKTSLAVAWADRLLQSGVWKVKRERL
jgi:LuxR family maltose regulon positive regulatory protein